MSQHYARYPFCGCSTLAPQLGRGRFWRSYLPQLDLSSHTTILSTTSRTVLKQKFWNPCSLNHLDEVQYEFPLYDGVCVVGFKCTIGHRVIQGKVKGKHEARADYKNAVDRGDAAGLLEQHPDASDCFNTRLGNVAAGQTIAVEIVYIGELKTDAETDGVRFTIPTIIAPRYGIQSADSSQLLGRSAVAKDEDGISIVVDVAVEDGVALRGVQSPSHPIAILMGRTSSMPEDRFDNRHASATLTQGTIHLDVDFVVVVTFKGHDTPRAILEHHPSIPNHRALMATLVPKFSLPPVRPEIIFVADRSGSMTHNIPTLISALKIFLKSLSVGTRFNICSFGSHYKSLWPRSKSYDESSLNAALAYVESFAADYGGTEMLAPIKNVVKNRYADMCLEVIVVTDGDTWRQQELLDFINDATTNSVRFFSLGIGAGASSSLIEGIARAGQGFAQFVGSHEKIDKRVIRMLKGALTPHIRDYTMEVQYDNADEEDYEMIECISESLTGFSTNSDKPRTEAEKQSISLFDVSISRDDKPDENSGKYDHLPPLDNPKLLRAPHQVPALFPFNRTTVYLLMSPETYQSNPKAVILRATSDHGPLKLRVPVQDVGTGDVVHQLGARKAVQELEEGRGWITGAKGRDGQRLREAMEGRWEEMVEREAVRLGVRFQVAGKHCAFVAVDDGGATSTKLLSQHLTGHERSYEQCFDPPGARAFARSAYSPCSASGTITQPNHRMYQPETTGSASQFAPPRQMMQMQQMPSSHTSHCHSMSQGTITNTSLFGASAAPAASPPITKKRQQAIRLRRQRASEVATSASNYESWSEEIGGAVHPQSRSRKRVIDDSSSITIHGTAATLDGDNNMAREASTWATDAAVVPQTDEETMQELVVLQKFDGSWEWATRLFAVLKLEEQTVRALLVGLEPRIMATLVALAFLQGKPGAEKEVFEMVVDKAKAWAVEAVGDDNRVEDFLAKIKTDGFGFGI